MFPLAQLPKSDFSQLVPETIGEDIAINYTFRMHDARIGRFLSIDPLAAQYPWNSPYAFSENRVIDAVELEGLEAEILNDGTVIFRLKDGYGATQVAEELQNFLGQDVDWLEDVIHQNMQYYSGHMSQEEMKDKWNEKHENNPTPTGTVYLIGTFQQPDNLVEKPKLVRPSDNDWDAFYDRVTSPMNQSEYKVRDARGIENWQLKNHDPNSLSDWFSLFVGESLMGVSQSSENYLRPSYDFNTDLPQNPFSLEPQEGISVKTTVLPYYNINVRHNNTGDQIRVSIKDSTFTIGDSMIRRVLDTVYYNQTTGETTSEKP